ncbi:HdeD family acid-resistance protein [Leucobacter albus]|uniref:HdeD family acid-resistance protein n=1 Tax=Leucobacter albus TaxID=272210 RepID=A0ABW3TN83_9MICO
MSWELIPDGGTPGGPRRRFPWGVPLAVGIVTVVIGLSLLIWPFFAASRILALLIGVAFIGNGIAAIVGSRARGLATPAAILFIVLGVIAIAFPELTVSVLVGFVAATMLFVGVVWLAIAIRMRAAMHWAFVALPAVLVALGLVAFVWPSLALVIAAFVAGLVTTLVGGSLIWAAVALRRRSA